jgi:hypothetical protein
VAKAILQGIARRIKIGVITEIIMFENPQITIAIIIGEGNQAVVTTALQIGITRRRGITGAGTAVLIIGVVDKEMIFLAALGAIARIIEIVDIEMTTQAVQSEKTALTIDMEMAVHQALIGAEAREFE